MYTCIHIDHPGHDRHRWEGVERPSGISRAINRRCIHSVLGRGCIGVRGAICLRLRNEIETSGLFWLMTSRWSGCGCSFPRATADRVLMTGGCCEPPPSSLAVGDRLHRNLALAALRKALVMRRPPNGFIHHLNRGSQYCSADYQAELRRHGIRISMSGKGNCFNNAMVEMFFKTTKSRARLANRLLHSRRSRAGHCPLYRRLLQSRPAPFCARLH